MIPMQNAMAQGRQTCGAITVNYQQTSCGALTWKNRHAVCRPLQAIVGRFYEWIKL